MGKLDEILTELSPADHFTRGPDRLTEADIRPRVASCLMCDSFTGVALRTRQRRPEGQEGMVAEIGVF